MGEGRTPPDPAENTSAAQAYERNVPIKILGHWEDARLHVRGGDLFIDIPAELIALVEADQPGVGVRSGYQLLVERHRIVDLVQARPRRRGTHLGACPQCGAQAGLHALSCPHFPKPSSPTEATEPPRPLTVAALAELRALPPSAWQGWPPSDYDQGLPVVEIRQDHLQALLDEAAHHRREASDPSPGRPGGWHERLHATFRGGLDTDGRWWIWHDGLAVYGDGRTYEEAKTDLLEEIAAALDEWKTLTDG